MLLRALQEVDFPSLFDSFNQAFSNASTQLNLTENEFKHRIFKKLHIDWDISAGAFDGDNMLGFIIHSSNVFQGIPTAYNGGTGVVPGFRNQKTAEDLYAFLIPKIQSKFLARILLEVIENNEHAIKLYEKVRFNFKRRLLFYKQIEKYSANQIHTVEEGKIQDVDFRFMDFESSFLDSEEHLTLGYEKVLLVKKNGELAGYLVFQPHLGRISQLSVSRIYRHEHIGGSLILEAQKYTSKALTIMNIPEDEVDFDAFLKHCSFDNQINQFEMELIT